MKEAAVKHASISGVSQPHEMTRLTIRVCSILHIILLYIRSSQTRAELEVSCPACVHIVWGTIWPQEHVVVLLMHGGIIGLEVTPGYYQILEKEMDSEPKDPIQ